MRFRNTRVESSPIDDYAKEDFIFRRLLDQIDLFAPSQLLCLANSVVPRSLVFERMPWNFPSTGFWPPCL